jgi:hypothetical protein
MYLLLHKNIFCCCEEHSVVFSGVVVVVVVVGVSLRLFRSSVVLETCLFCWGLTVGVNFFP